MLTPLERIHRKWLLQLDDVLKNPLFEVFRNEYRDLSDDHTRVKLVMDFYNIDEVIAMDVVERNNGHVYVDAPQLVDVLLVKRTRDEDALFETYNDSSQYIQFTLEDKLQQYNEAEYDFGALGA